MAGMTFEKVLSRAAGWVKPRVGQLDMHLLRCTNKLFTEMGFKKRDLPQKDVPQAGLGDWYKYAVDKLRTVLAFRNRK